MQCCLVCASCSPQRPTDRYKAHTSKANETCSVLCSCRSSRRWTVSCHHGGRQRSNCGQQCLCRHPAGAFVCLLFCRRRCSSGSSSRTCIAGKAVGAIWLLCCLKWHQPWSSCCASSPDAACMMQPASAGVGIQASLIFYTANTLKHKHLPYCRAHRWWRQRGTRRAAQRKAQHVHSCAGHPAAAGAADAAGCCMGTLTVPADDGFSGCCRLLQAGFCSRLAALWIMHC